MLIHWLSINIDNEQELNAVLEFVKDWEERKRAINDYYWSEIMFTIGFVDIRYAIQFAAFIGREFGKDIEYHDEEV